MVRVGGGLGLGLGLWLWARLRQQRRRRGLSLVQKFVSLFYFVSFRLNLGGQVLSPEFQGLQRGRRWKRRGQRVGNVGAVVRKIS